MAADTTPPADSTTVDPQTQAELDQLHAALLAAQATNIGFPAATDIDVRPLVPFLDMMLNNLGDPNVEGDYPHHTKAQEREAVDAIAGLLRAPAARPVGLRHRRRQRRHRTRPVAGPQPAPTAASSTTPWPRTTAYPTRSTGSP